MLEVFYYFLLCVFILISVAFVTLLERKVLGLIQFRLGPNKVGFKGIFQPVGDGVKLLLKGEFSLSRATMWGFKMMPYFMIIMMMIMWSLLPDYSGLSIFKSGFLIVICLFSLGVYPIMLGGWFSGSSYSAIGSLRSIAQMISYEVSMIIIFITIILLVGSYDLSKYSGWGLGFVFMIPSSFMLFISLLVELNRTPVDLVEGESELVSGFNTEYGGMGFALIFLGEYGMIMFSGGLYGLIVMGLGSMGVLMLLFMIFFLLFVIILRGVLPRVRYDSLMYFCWTSVLGLILGYLVMVIGVKVILG